MTTFEPRHSRSDAEGCGAVLAELRAQADAMRDAGDEKGAEALRGYDVTDEGCEQMRRRFRDSLSGDEEWEDLPVRYRRDQ